MLLLFFFTFTFPWMGEGLLQDLKFRRVTQAFHKTIKIKKRKKKTDSCLSNFFMPPWFFPGGGTSSYISYFYLILVIPFPSFMHVITAVCQSCQPVTLHFLCYLLIRLQQWLAMWVIWCKMGLVVQSFFSFLYQKPSGSVKNTLVMLKKASVCNYP